jgi:ABC-2 type transport system permease protein
MTISIGRALESHSRPGLILTLASEWAKFRALRSTRIIVLVAFTLTIGITLLVCVLGGAGLSEAQARGKYNVIFFSSFSGTAAMATLGAHFVAVEYTRGMIAATLTATPVRWRVLAAKLLIISGFTLVFATAVSFVNFFMSQALLAASGVASLRITDDGMLRAVSVFIGLSAMTYALLGAAVAVFTRNAGGAVVLTFLFSIIPVVMAPLLGRWWGELVPRYVPGAVVESLAGVAEPGSPGYLPTPAAALVLFLWLVVFISAAFVQFARRDT